MTLTYKTAEDLRDEILSNIPNTYQKSIGTDLWEWAFGIGKSFKIAWDKLFYVASALKDIRNLTLEDMANLIYQLRGLEHRQATFATGELTLTGTDTVTLGNIFATKDGLQFKALETKEITESGTVKAECHTAGKIGNVPVGHITEFVTYKGNFTAVTNENAFSGGYEKETKEELYDRYISDISEPIVSGNDNFYKKEILNVSGVGKVKIKPLWNGDNTVKGIILGNDGEPASDSLVSAVQDYIDPFELQSDGTKKGWGCGLGKAPLGAYFTAEKATAKYLNISAKLVFVSGYDKDTVIVAVNKEIKAYLKQIAFEQNFVSFAKIGNAILDAEGVLDYSDLKINGDVKNIAVAETETTAEVAVLKTFTNLSE